MKFIDKIIEWCDRKPGFSKTNDFGSRLICHVNENVNGDYLHVLYKSLCDKERKTFKKDLISINKSSGNAIDAYLDFLEEANGAILYSGAIVFFGYTQKMQSSALYDTPSSILKMNAMDSISNQYPMLLYIGNAMHINKGTIKFYLNLDDGVIAGYYKDEVTITWDSINDFFKYIISKYDANYLPTGYHIFNGDRAKGVYDNAQLFKEY